MIIKKTIYNDDKNYAPREGEQIFGPNENRSTAESPIVQAQMAREDAAKASKRASEAVKTAGEAAEIANAVSQKVWSDDSGLHISDGNQDAAATRNTIWNSLGMLFRKGLNPILGVLTGDNPRVAIYDGQGSGEEHEVASFGASAVISSKDANTSSSIKIEPSEMSFWKNGSKRGVIAGEPFGDLENPIFFGKLYDYSHIEDGMYCAKSAVVISSSKRTGVDSEQRSTISVKPDSININSLTVDWNGTIRAHKDSMKTLWSGAWFMDASHTATLSEKVSEQLTGIVLVWSYYTDGAAQNYGWHTTFVPKAMVQLHSGVGYDIELRRTKNAAFGTKYVYVNDNSIVGHADNVATGTANNVPYANNKWVLRYVFGC